VVAPDPPQFGSGTGVSLLPPIKPFPALPISPDEPPGAGVAARDVPGVATAPPRLQLDAGAAVAEAPGAPLAMNLRLTSISPSRVMKGLSPEHEAQSAMRAAVAP
jgi:hypothetical protein